MGVSICLPFFELDVSAHRIATLGQREQLIQSTQYKSIDQRLVHTRVDWVK